MLVLAEPAAAAAAESPPDVWAAAAAEAVSAAAGEWITGQPISEARVLRVRRKTRAFDPLR